MSAKQERTPRSQMPERILNATRDSVLKYGFRRLRSAQIANMAGTTESTMFRHFSSLDQLVETAYDRSWNGVTRALMEYSYRNPVSTSSTQRLEGELSAILDLADDPDAQFAFGHYPLPHRVSENPPQSQEQAFKAHFLMLCHKVVMERNHPLTAEKLYAQLMGFLATSWHDLANPDPDKRIPKQVMTRVINGIISMEKDEA
jgi:AcrR family transcriptional regulator